MHLRQIRHADRTCRRLPHICERCDRRTSQKWSRYIGLYVSERAFLACRVLGIPLAVVQKEVSDIIEHRLLVGHAIHNDLEVIVHLYDHIRSAVTDVFSDQVLFLSHPKRRTRDTQRYKAFRALLNGGLPSLKTLADKVLGLKIQTGAHDSVSDTWAESPESIHPPCLLFVGGRCSGDDATLRSTSA